MKKEENLQVRTKKRKKLQRPRLVISTPNDINERWSMDFVYDQLANGRRFRVLNVIDDFSREVIGQLAAFSISGQHVTRFLDQLGETRGLPKQIICDNVLNLESSFIFSKISPHGSKNHFFDFLISQSNNIFQ